MDFKYSEYCTVFWFKEKGIYHVWMWDEIKDKPMMKHKVEDKESALKLIDEYVSKAPEGIICHDVSVK